jgi:integrase
MKHEKKDPLFLTSAELKAIESKTFSCERVEIIKDLYIFSCYTSLAFADVMKLSKNDIQEINGEKWLITKRTKTNTDSDIYLLPVAEQIINKYSSHPDCVTSGRVFPKRTGQKTNLYLKELADICNIKKPLNFHSARHTYGTTVTIPNGVSLQAVSRQMGHSNLAMTLHYSRMQKNVIADQMRKLNEIYPAQEPHLEVA